MSDLSAPAPPLVSTLMKYSPGLALAEWVGVPTSTSWPTANLAFYIPIILPFPYLVQRVYWVNGTATTSTNRDLGIYTGDLQTKLYSTGSAAASGTSVPQYTTLGTPIMLSPGRYYIGLATSTTTANCGPTGVFSAATANIGGASGSGILQQASALPLPSTPTPATLGTSAFVVPHCGLSNVASGF